MSRHYWSVYIKDSSDNYVLDGQVPVPNENLNLSIIATRTKIQLADGSNSFVTPETKFNIEPFTMTWTYEAWTDLLIVQILTYISNDDYVQIVTHNEGLVFTGKFVDVKGEWQVGIDGDIFVVSATFENMDA